MSNARSGLPLATAAVAIVVAAGTLGARHAGWLERAELAVLGIAVRGVTERPETDPRIALVEVTEADIQDLGQWPLPDVAMARVLDTLGSAGARAIGVDIYRDLPVPPGTEELEAAFARQPRVVVVSKFPDHTSTGVGPPPALAGSDQVGFNNMVVDPDGIARRGLLFMEAGEEVATSFPLLLALFYLGDDGVFATADPDEPELLKLGNTTYRPLSSTAGSYAGVDAGGYQYLLDPRALAQCFDRVELRQLLAGEVDPAVFRDRIVLIGMNADSVRDTFHVDFENCWDRVNLPGVALHGYMASQLVRYAVGEGEPLSTLTDATEALLIVAFTVLGAAAGVRTRTTARFLLFGASAIVALWFGGSALLAAGWWIPVVPPLLGCLAAVTCVTAYVSSREKAERGELMALFSRHQSPQLAATLWERRDEFTENGRLRPERLTATALFLDIKGYTSSAEKLDPAELMGWLDSYLSELSQRVQDGGGLVEDYFGDGMMALFGCPIPHRDPEQIREDARSAVGAALEMEAAVRRLNDHWSERDLPAVGIRVGICTGSVVAGTMGGSKLKYSVVGDAVVTAQRLESLDYAQHDFVAEPVRILISAQTRSYVDGMFRTQEAGEFVLKGKVEPVLVHKVIGRAETPPEGERG
jgi:adenylate cyclase